MDIHKSTYLVLDEFLRLPRRAQEMLFERLEHPEVLLQEDPYNVFRVVGFSTEGCKSPIEQILFFAFYIRQEERGDLFFELWPQEEIKINGKTYYADFSMCLGPDGVLLIECDGHDYHHRSKQQVSNDYERENALKLAGYDIIRFTGSQIYADPYKCADMILDYVASKQHGGSKNGRAEDVRKNNSTE